MEIFVILSKKVSGHTTENALGHELHLTRYILYDMLQKNIIDNNVNIVTNSKDRFFLYSNIFTKIHEWNDYIKNKTINNNIKVIDLTKYSSGLMIEHISDKFERTSKLVDYINNINIINLNENEKYKSIIENDFIVVHYRFSMVNSDTKITHNGNTQNLFKIIDKIRKHTNNTIVIFCSKLPNDEKVQKDLECKNIVVIDDLQCYASFLSNKKCKLLISEWSGGGQLSQYCLDGGKIIYYFDYYPSNDYELNFDSYQKNANLPNNIFNYWDFKTTRNNEREYYKTFDLMINDLSKNFNN
jgi:hypothetical protein